MSLFLRKKDRNRNKMQKTSQLSKQPSPRRKKLAIVSFFIRMQLFIGERVSFCVLFPELSDEILLKNPTKTLSSSKNEQKSESSCFFRVFSFCFSLFRQVLEFFVFFFLCFGVNFAYIVSFSVIFCVFRPLEFRFIAFPPTKSPNFVSFYLILRRFEAFWFRFVAFANFALPSVVFSEIPKPVGYAASTGALRVK